MMTIRVATIVCVAILFGAEAFAIPKTKESNHDRVVKEIRAKQKDIPPMPSFVSGAVKKPGAYQFKGPAKIYDMIEVAGGFSFSETTAPTRGWILVYRPTKKDPEAWTASIQCDLDVKKFPDMNYKACNRPLLANDVVIVRLVDKFPYVLP